MKTLRSFYFFIGLILTFNVNAAITAAGYEVQNLLSEEKRCITTWSSESSKAGEDTEVFGVRELNGKTQYQVYHSAEYPRLWTWDFRVQDIMCK